MTSCRTYKNIHSGYAVGRLLGLICVTAGDADADAGGGSDCALWKYCGLKNNPKYKCPVEL